MMAAQSMVGAPVIALAQYLTGLTVQQDIWGEVTGAMISLFDAELCAIGERDKSGAIQLQAWAYADPALAAYWSTEAEAEAERVRDQDRDLRECIAETLDTGFLGWWQSQPEPEPMTLICLPITRESRVTNVLVVGHRRAESPSNERLNLYLAVAGLVGTAATRLAAERELHEHRHHLAALVEARTAELHAANAQLQREIRERQRTQDIMAARLRLIALADSHSLAELLRATLDEVEALTDSHIGFYHFIGLDQRTVSLQAWSTNTLRDMCKIQGEGQHYPIDQAGVWVDSVRQRRAIIHNDYLGLPHRKGLPPGHAPVIRMLTVPVIRVERVVAILGVGNKPDDYREEDVSTVAGLADLAWETVESKRLQDLLRHQATTDELTGLANRRAFMDQAGRELKRAQRHGKLFSLALIDLDRFKQINDTHGHAVGDQALVALTRVCLDSIREIDLLARLGGDEFALLLPETDQALAYQVVERMRLALTARPVRCGDLDVKLSISAGVACHAHPEQSLDALLIATDQALYRAKEAGRNRVVVSARAGEYIVKAESVTIA
ncbi:putative diguanylate cyclase YdaM [Thiorhodovibrio winogradskyi]|uniref:diguanylate cyclase n=1 Tax=Thiorhodovibrio winogradskyi TaxID=77007 RepID=A0ABZ0S796_9GAMM|nr:diguanylate cyclase [Thiorhodovibrio winogradskyi]